MKVKFKYENSDNILHSEDVLTRAVLRREFNIDTLESNEIELTSQEFSLLTQSKKIFFEKTLYDVGDIILNIEEGEKSFVVYVTHVDDNPLPF